MPSAPFFQLRPKRQKILFLRLLAEFDFLIESLVLIRFFNTQIEKYGVLVLDYLDGGSFKALK